MPALFLTPASISFLTQFILAQAISLFLILRLWRRPSHQLGMLTGFFALATLFIGLMLLDAAFSPDNRLLVVYAQNTVLALALVFLIQFAYCFPQTYPQHKWERYAALVASMGYFLWEAGYMLYRYVSAAGVGDSRFSAQFRLLQHGRGLADRPHRLPAPEHGRRCPFRELAAQAVETRRKVSPGGPRLRAGLWHPVRAGPVQCAC